MVENPYYSEPLLMMEGAQYLGGSISYVFYVPYNIVELLKKTILQDTDINVKALLFWNKNTKQVIKIILHC